MCDLEDDGGSPVQLIAGGPYERAARSINGPLVSYQGASDRAAINLSSQMCIPSTHDHCRHQVFVSVIDLHPQSSQQNVSTEVDAACGCSRIAGIGQKPSLQLKYSQGPDWKPLTKIYTNEVEE